jgi:hypothetical protein
MIMPDSTHPRRPDDSRWTTELVDGLVSELKRKVAAARKATRRMAAQPVRVRRANPREFAEFLEREMKRVASAVAIALPVTGRVDL